MHKLDWQSAEEWLPHSYAPRFITETTSAETSRLVAGVPDGDSSVLLKLVECLTPPFFVLYVLHTPRGEGDPGRYQSPELDLDALQSFVSRFASFFAGDARFDLWVHSPRAKGTIVWDRHNLIYGYGPVECFGRALDSLGFSEGRPIIPSPHLHHYRKEFDEDAKTLLSAFSWQCSPLRPEDEQ
ncbi:hypothetical protein [Denitromonas iodatirespirans]|uniref:Uncharacterized protein n=1 Tax=Denitromonas iodatirespirans TaxID=2795389 RepID=A0A944H966_DENI1|nr:hypothetical protein [Denitromonas iodatirespirans]MBT0962110.1 hypothetical protein [Denitromonas iodatirespirans]